MFELNVTRAVYLHQGSIDFRKSINGLASLVEHGLGLNAFADALFSTVELRSDSIQSHCEETCGILNGWKGVRGV